MLNFQRCRCIAGPTSQCLCRITDRHIIYIEGNFTAEVLPRYLNSKVLRVLRCTHKSSGIFAPFDGLISVASFSTFASLGRKSPSFVHRACRVLHYFSPRVPGDNFYRYEATVSENPIMTKALTSCVAYGLGDFTAQLFTVGSVHDCFRDWKCAILVFCSASYRAADFPSCDRTWLSIGETAPCCALIAFRCPVDRY